ncbi:hypothetical protein VTH82DRAFT_1724 [Thermothelomyces myriococcoides]
MHDLETLRNGGYRGAGLTQLRLACPLAEFPEEILELGDTLELLDLSGTGLPSLPANLGSALPNLRTALFSNCAFKVFPREIASCANLETVVFRNNGMEEIPEDAFPPRLRCLILTGNRLSSVPSSIGRCDGLEQCILTSNQLKDLPAELANCKRLHTLRLSSNRLSSLPSWLSTFPELAFLSFASNPCAAPTTNGVHTPHGVASIPWTELEIQQALGTNTSQGLWHQSPHFAEDVAIKLFRDPPASHNSDVGDDGSAADEMLANLKAGAHESLVTILGQIHGHPDEDIAGISQEEKEKEKEKEEKGTLQGGIVMQLLFDFYVPLSTLTPTTTTTTTATTATTVITDDDATVISAPPSSSPPIDARTALQMLSGLASCLAHLHGRGIAHGAVRPENVLASVGDAHALLTHFRAATRYCSREQPPSSDEDDDNNLPEKVEVLAFGRLVDFVLLRLVRPAGSNGGGDGGGGGDDDKEGQAEAEKGLRELRDRCVAADTRERPTFEEVTEALEGLMGWRGMMRIPNIGSA